MRVPTLRCYLRRRFKIKTFSLIMKQVHITEEQLKILKEMKGKRLVDICRATNINYKTLWKWRHYYKKI